MCMSSLLLAITSWTTEHPWSSKNNLKSISKSCSTRQLDHYLYVLYSKAKILLQWNNKKTKKAKMSKCKWPPRDPTTIPHPDLLASAIDNMHEMITYYKIITYDSPSCTNSYISTPPPHMHLKKTINVKILTPLLLPASVNCHPSREPAML